MESVDWNTQYLVNNKHPSPWQVTLSWVLEPGSPPMVKMFISGGLSWPAYGGEFRGNRLNEGIRYI